MITFNYETTFILKEEKRVKKWIQKVIHNHDYKVGEINYIFCDDIKLHKLNVEFLQHDTLTDIISFDTTLGKLIGGDIFISVERVFENAIEYKTYFEEEICRVIIHGILHFLGYKDKTTSEKSLMRTKENESILLLKN